MKHVVKLTNNRYLHLDSYGESNWSHRFGQVLCAVIVLSIASITAGAIVGIDITNIDLSSIQRNK